MLFGFVVMAWLIVVDVRRFVFASCSVVLFVLCRLWCYVLFVLRCFMLVVVPCYCCLLCAFFLFVFVKR